MPLWARKCSEYLLGGNGNNSTVTADKVPCVVDVLACLSLYVCISNMDLLLCTRKYSENLVRGCCIHFAVTSDKEQCVVDGLAGLCVCVCV
jgi:hypothetical protein